MLKNQYLLLSVSVHSQLLFLCGVGGLWRSKKYIILLRDNKTVIYWHFYFLIYMIWFLIFTTHHDANAANKLAKLKSTKHTEAFFDVFIAISALFSMYRVELLNMHQDS